MFRRASAWIVGPRTGHEPRRGDIFAVEHRSHVFAFGRVVHHDVDLGDQKPARLVTFSVHTGPVSAVPLDWSPAHLAMAPRIVGDDAWSRGLARPVGQLGLVPDQDTGPFTFATPQGDFVDRAGARVAWAQGYLVRRCRIPWAQVLSTLQAALAGQAQRPLELGPGAPVSGPRLT